MSKPLHEKIDPPDADDSEQTTTPHEEAARRHLSDFLAHLTVLEDRAKEVEALLDGDVPDSVAERERGDVPTTVGAGRLLEAVDNLQRAAGQIYALCATLDREEG